MAARVSGSRNGLGASSITFWLRLWMEHSRSPRWTQAPCASARTWISIWRGWVTKRSMNIRSSPKAAIASFRDAAKPSRHAASSQATRMPLPPPPADALSITG